MSIKVSIVEDDARVREGMAIVINGASGFSCLSTFPNAEAAIRQMPKNWPDVVLMDIHLPEMSGIDCVTKLKAMKPDLQVIMLTAYLENEKIFRSLMSGATGYLIKDTPPAEILEAVQEVHRGGSPMSSQIARKVVQYIQKISPPSPNAATTPLSAREQEILASLAKGFQYKEIAASLSISLDTVRTHVRHIYEKLHVKSRTEAVVKYLSQTEQ